MHTDALNTDPDSSPPEVKPSPMKTIYMDKVVIGAVGMHGFDMLENVLQFKIASCGSLCINYSLRL